jgi:hypothetical protein
MSAILIQYDLLYCHCYRKDCASRHGGLACVPTIVTQYTSFYTITPTGYEKQIGSVTVKIRATVHLKSQLLSSAVRTSSSS